LTVASDAIWQLKIAEEPSKSMASGLANVGGGGFFLGAAKRTHYKYYIFTSNNIEASYLQSPVRRCI
jgi:hypothetical protein